MKWTGRRLAVGVVCLGLIAAACGDDDTAENTVSTDASAVESVPIDDDSELANRSIAETGLRDRDIVVLTIHRGSITIPNPKGTREILPGDSLLCFGKTLTLKSLAPRTRRRKRRRTSVA